VSHKGIRTLIEKTALKLQDDVQFSYGVDTDFNQARKKGNLLINTSPMSSVPTYGEDGRNYFQTWSVEMVFFQVDNTSKLEYTKILDHIDPLLDRFINDMNFFSVRSDQITLSSFSKSPFIKATSDILTGWLLTFQIFEIGDFDPCPEC